MWYWCEASGLAFLRQTSRRQQQLLRRQRLTVPEETLRGGRAGPPRNQKQQENVPDTNKQQLAATSGHRWDPPSTTHPLAIGSINTLTSPGVILSSDPDESDYFNWKGAKWRPAFCLCPPKSMQLVMWTQMQDREEQGQASQQKLFLYEQTRQSARIFKAD